MARIGAVRPWFRLFAALPLLLYLEFAQAKDPVSTDEATEQLATLAADIRAIQQKLDAQEKRRGTLQHALREAELQISESDQLLAEIRRSQEALQQQLISLNNQQTQLLAAQSDRTEIIERGIQQLWVLQQGGGLRVWLVIKILSK